MQNASRAEWREACRREAAIRSLVAVGPVTYARADEAAKELAISRSLGLGKPSRTEGTPATKTYQAGSLLAYSVVCWISLATSPVQPV
jgi:hypothetical protein